MPSFLMPLVEGFEEIEAITTIDLLRRAEIDVTTAGIGGCYATGSHGITVETDAIWAEAIADTYDGIIPPGGPGTKELRAMKALLEMVRRYHGEGKLLAAICAAPTVLAAAGILDGVRATCFPACEKDISKADLCHDAVVTSGNIITSRGAGTTVPFALAIIAHQLGAETAESIARQIIYSPDSTYVIH